MLCKIHSNKRALRMLLCAPYPRTVLIQSGGDLVGDVLHKLPFLRALRASFPNSRLVYLAQRFAVRVANDSGVGHMLAVEGWLNAPAPNSFPQS